MKPHPAIALHASPPSARAADSIETMCAQYLAKVKRWARRLAGPSADLEDLVHEIFLVALCEGFQFRGEASIDTWLFGITKGLADVRGGLRFGRIRVWLNARAVGLVRSESVKVQSSSPGVADSAELAAWDLQLGGGAGFRFE